MVHDRCSGEPGLRVQALSSGHWWWQALKDSADDVCSGELWTCFERVEKKRLFDLCCVSTGARPHIRYAHCQIPVLADQAGGSSGHIFETGNCGYVALLTEVHTGHLHGRTQHCSLCPLNKDVPHLSWARLLKSMIQTPPMPQTDLLTAHLLSPAQEDLHPDNGHNPRTQRSSLTCLSQ